MVSAAILSSVGSNATHIFDLLYPRGLARYGSHWITEIMLDPESGALEMLCKCSPEMWHRIHSLLVVLVANPVSRGRLYAHMFDFRSAFQSVMKNDSVFVISQYLQLMNEVGGHGCTRAMLHSRHKYGRLPIHDAISRNSVDTVRFLVGIGCDLVPSPVDRYRMCLDFARSPEMKDFILTLEGDVSIEEETRIHIRFETYFGITLLWRLLHCV